MNPDSFASNSASLIFSWLFGIVFLLYVAFGLLNMLMEADAKREGHSIGLRVFMGWIVVCAIVLSPLRYVVLQLLLNETFAVQGFSALLSACIFLIPIGLAFFTLFTISLALPVSAIACAVGTKDPASRMRMVLGALIAPFLFYAGNVLFFWVLPYAAYSTHWLGGANMMSATNGPAEYFFEYVVDVDISYLPSRITGNVGDTAKQRLRAHIRSLYLGRKAQRSVTIRYFNKSFENLERAVEIVNSGDGFLTTLKAADYERVKAFRNVALREAENVDIEILNESYDGLGNHFHNEYLSGLRKLVEGDETPADQMLLAGSIKRLQGHELLDKWVDWYSANNEAIQGKK